MDALDWSIVAVMAAVALFFLYVAVVETRDAWREHKANR